MQVYAELLISKIEEIGVDPSCVGTRPCLDVFEGGFRCHIGRHYIYFEIFEDYIAILRILYDRSVPAKYIKR